MKPLAKTLRALPFAFLSLFCMAQFPQSLGNVGVNLALNKPSKMSSYDYGTSAKGANDGGKNGGFGIHTKTEDHPWWQVDLEKNYEVGMIKVYNRMDCCSDRANSLVIDLSLDGNQWTRVYTYSDSKPFGGIAGGKETPLEAMITPRKARFVRVMLNQRNCLHLDEVEVYEKVALDPFAATGMTSY